MVELQFKTKPDPLPRERIDPQYVPQFSSLDIGKPPWKGYGVGFVLQCILIALMIVFGVKIGSQKIFHQRYETLLFPVTPPKPPAIRPMHMPRALRRLEAYKAPPPPKLHVIHPPRTRPLPKPAAVVMRNPLRLPKINLPKPKRIVRKVHFNSNVREAMRRPAARVHTGAFFGAPTADPRHQLAPRQVQTGGFGDPNGIHGPQTTRHGNVTAVGSFGLPEGPGHGNGSGGRHGASGAIASVGFGSGISGGVSSGPGGSVQSAGFNNQTETATRRRSSRAAVQPLTRSVVILYKPHPGYTAEARAKHLQGEVWLSVIFLASGRVQVRHVIQGLGAGLDQSAIQAARAIRFQPALRGGKPVDFPARIRIRFQLAH